MIPKSDRANAAAWARFRFSVVGSLLSSPPAHGDLQTALQTLASKTWTHPATGREVQFAMGTIERWYYTARGERDDPVRVLERAVRKDRGKVTLAAALTQELVRQYRDHPHWTYQLHYDNLAAVVKADPAKGPLRSYSTVRRYMQTHGLVRKSRPASKGRPGEERAVQRREEREIRSYEAEYVGSLWHLDFHHGSLKVLTSRGQWARPIVLGILDDHSRLCCHLQWYLSETAEDLVHGLSQAIQKRGLPRALMTDNGSAMIADEVTEGLLRLGIVHERTLPYSAYQNGKQEFFWGHLEGRLMEMLDGVGELTLAFLNQATQAWAEIEYNRAVHRETGCSPVERFAHAPDVLRESPTSNALRDAFRLEMSRRQRRSDGTISLEGVRFELPSRYRHFRDVSVRYARWDLSRVDLVDPRTGTILAPIYPLDRQANADGQRRLFELGTRPGDGTPPSGDDSPPAEGQPQASPPRTPPPLPPLLKQLLAEYSATGTPPAYLPKTSPADEGARS
jgi:transposase InsO family protein